MRRSMARGIERRPGVPGIEDERLVIQRDDIAGKLVAIGKADALGGFRGGGLMGVELDLGKLAGLEGDGVVRLGALPAQAGVAVNAEQDAVQLILIEKGEGILGLRRCRCRCRWLRRVPGTWMPGFWAAVPGRCHPR